MTLPGGFERRTGKKDTLSIEARFALDRGKRRRACGSAGMVRSVRFLYDDGEILIAKLVAGTSFQNEFALFKSNF